MQSTVKLKGCQNQLKLKYSDRYKRLNNLYWILNDRGERVKFSLNCVQYLLYTALWWLNIILKSRQHGITTFICIYFLDACLFNSNIRAGVIAHRLEDGKKIFRDKIKFAYENLPDAIKQARTLIKDDACELLLDNNSGIYVSTTMRSGTLQYLHISEYGWICAHATQKAQEIKSGALETIHEGGQVFIESTAEGPIGDFKEMCCIAQAKVGRQLSKMDYKFHFFPWFQKVENQTDPEFVTISDDVKDYLDGVERICSIKLTPNQRAWYAQKKQTLKYLIYKEHPSTAEEAFQSAVEGAYYIEELSFAREQGRITRVPHLTNYPVHTVCDIGLGAGMPWIFYQRVGIEVHIIDCFVMSGKDDPYRGIEFYKRMLSKYTDEKRYIYGKHFCPFDIDKGELGTGKTLYDTARSVGLVFEPLPREISVLDGVQRLLNLFPRIWINADTCQPLIEAWSAYHRQWIDGLGIFTEEPVHDKSSHFADAGRYLSYIVANDMDIMVEPGIKLSKIRELQARYRVG